MLRVESVEYLDEEHEVFDIEVEDDHSFIVHGAVLHNCIICGADDGHVYALDEIKPELPIHPDCRGLYVPVLKSWRELGIDANELPEGTRASMDGQVAESKTFADMVAEAKAKGDDKRLNELLGPGRAQLYKQGVPLDDMVKGGQAVPIKELQAGKKENAA